MVRRSGEQDVRTALACETLVEDGMQVAFLDYFTASERHVYRIEEIGDSWEALRTILCRILPGSGRCGLIDGAVTVVDSSLNQFREEYEALLMA